MKSLGLCGALALLAAPAAATTWIVDDDGGAGVDFTDIQPAIAAAADGDVILVLGGLYSGFVLDKALVIVGSPGAVVRGSADLAGIATGSFAALAGLSAVSTTIDSCTTTVVVDELALDSWIDVVQSQDVRLQRIRGNPGQLEASFRGSRVECLDGGWIGAPGTTCVGACGGICDACPCLPSSGGAALRAIESGGLVPSVHVYRTNATGGVGGVDCFQIFQASDGSGILGSGEGELLVAGQPDQAIAGGGTASLGALTLTLGMRGRLSGVSVKGNIVVTAGASLQVPAIEDPTLRTLGPVLPGGVLSFRANAAPGSSVDLLLGRLPAVVDLGGPEEDLLLIEVRRFPLGVVGASGEIGFDFTTPAQVGDGFTFFTQAEVTLPGGERRFTNSVPVVLR